MTFLHKTGDAPDFTILVTQYYLALRGRGLMLSSLEAGIVQRWKGSGVPVSVVCEALKAAFAAHRKRHGEGGGGPSIRYCEPLVEEAIGFWKNQVQVGARKPQNQE